MKNYKQQIKEYKEEIEEKYVRAEAENKIVKACQNILSESVLSKQSHRTSYFEFLYEQTKFIKKRWWILQGCILMCLWIWLSNYTSDIKDMMRIMGISATIFVVLIIPEIWKNRRNGAIEIEQASYYTLRQICTARMLMFGVVDLVIVMVFLAIMPHLGRADGPSGPLGVPHQYPVLRIVRCRAGPAHPHQPHGAAHRRGVHRGTLCR